MLSFDYKKYNTILGWLAFAIALITYTLTLEPTVSYWDCGEYIATSVKLEVGHPPGAPLFQLMGRFFSLFAFGFFFPYLTVLVFLTSFVIFHLLVPHFLQVFLN